MEVALTQQINSYHACSDPRKRDELAIELIAIFSPKIERFVRSRNKDAASADDQVQEILKAIALGINRVRFDHDLEVWAWVFRVVRNRIASCREKDHALGRVLFFDSELVAEVLENELADSSYTAGDQADLREALAMLHAVSRPCLDFLWDRYVVGLTHAELGNLYGIKEGAAQKRVERCLELANNLVNAKPTPRHV